MFKKIIEKLKFGSCKTKTTDDVNAFKESEKKKDDSWWSTIVDNVVSSGMDILTPFLMYWSMKKPIRKRSKMVTCNKCYNKHHDQCMQKAGMFSCDCNCLSD